MFNTAKKEFILKYQGLINALNNTFNNVEVKKDFFSLDDKVYLKKELTLGNNHLELFFYLKENDIKLRNIKQEIDFDYYISNKHTNGVKFDLNKNLDYCDFVNYYSPTSNFSIDKDTYIEYLNDLSIKNHLKSKHTGDNVLGDNHNTGLHNQLTKRMFELMQKGESTESIKQTIDSEFEKDFESIRDEKGKKETFSTHETVYDALGRPEGIKQYFFNHANMVYHEANRDIPAWSAMEKNPQILYGYKHKSNFVLHIEIKKRKSILFESFTLLDSNSMNEITLTDYDNIKNKLDEFLESFEKSATHVNLSNNLNVGSLVYELTGKNYLKPDLNNPTNSIKNNSLQNNSLDYMQSTLIPIKTKMCLFFSTELGRFESNGYNLIHGNFLCPPDHIILLDALKLVEEALWNSLAGLIAEVGAQSIYGKFLLDKWDNLIDESKQEELQKFLNVKNIKLIKFHDESNDDSSLYLG
jgi:hypothetical protein